MKTLIATIIFNLFLISNANAFTLGQDKSLCKKYPNTSSCNTYTNEVDITSNKIDMIKSIENSLKNKFLYVSEDPDIWITFGSDADIKGFHRGDCEDFVHTMADILHKKGIPQSRLKRYIVEDTSSEAHMILQYTDYDNQKYWIGDVFGSVIKYNQVTYSPIAYNQLGNIGEWNYTKE